MKTKILIVDDDALIRAMLNDMLSDAGYEVIEAEDGKKVRTLLASENPKLLIIDLVMPDQEGVETIMQLRESFLNLPIIAISSHSSYLDWAGLLGANAILKKPINAKKLLNIVEKVLLDE